LRSNEVYCPRVWSWEMMPEIGSPGSIRKKRKDAESDPHSVIRYRPSRRRMYLSVGFPSFPLFTPTGVVSWGSFAGTAGAGFPATIRVLLEFSSSPRLTRPRARVRQPAGTRGGPWRRHTGARASGLLATGGSQVTEDKQELSPPVRRDRIGVVVGRPPLPVRRVEHERVRRLED